MHEDSLKIRRLNDRFRQGDDGVPGVIVATIGINDLLDDDVVAGAELYGLVRSYTAFTKDNDPWGEHDFGAFQFRGEQCFWKIDVLDPSLEMAPLDPTDPVLSRRVLTIMLASEY